MALIFSLLIIAPSYQKASSFAQLEGLSLFPVAFLFLGHYLLRVIAGRISLMVVGMDDTVSGRAYFLAATTDDRFSKSTVDCLLVCISAPV